MDGKWRSNQTEAHSYFENSKFRFCYVWIDTILKRMIDTRMTELEEPSRERESSVSTSNTRRFCSQPVWRPKLAGRRHSALSFVQTSFFILLQTRRRIPVRPHLRSAGHAHFPSPRPGVARTAGNSGPTCVAAARELAWELAPLLAPLLTPPSRPLHANDWEI